MTGNGRNYLGPFEIIELIGTGGFASVYRAHDPRLACDVAIKILAENHALNPDVRERFIREAQALRRIDSPGVVSLYEINETPDGRPYLVLELADRHNFVRRHHERFGQGWRPSGRDVAKLVVALADALQTIHDQRLVHRDVTPANLLIRSAGRADDRTTTSFLAPDERLLLSDLGLVKDLAVSSGLTAGSGTAGYAAPEQQEQLGSIDLRVDIYSASAVVLWFVTGRSPAGFHQWAETLVDGGWPKPFVAALQTGMSKDPDDRHADIATWKREVLAALPGDGATGSQPVGRGAAANGRKDRRRVIRHKAVRYGVAGLLAAIALIAAVFIFRPDGLATDVAGSGFADEATGDSNGLSPTTGSVASSLAARPDMQHAFFATGDNDRTILTLIWGAASIPSAVVASEVAIAVDGGEWVNEFRAEQTSARGWQQYSTTSADGDRPVDAATDYKVRVRWVLSDGSTTGWSRELTVAGTG